MTSGVQRPAAGGRRERNKAVLRDRIFDAAARLFTEHGYEAVTTQQIADAADVGTGTVFRYFPTKADLLVEVMSDRIRGGVADGRRVARDTGDPVDAILALVAPLVDASGQRPENTAAFQRETLFGNESQRDQRVRQVAEMEDAIADILAICLPAPPGIPASELHLAAHAIYATLYVDIVRAITGAGERDRLTATLREHAAYLLGRLLANGAG